MKTLATFFIFLVAATMLRAGEYKVEVRIMKGTRSDELGIGNFSSQEEENARIEKITYNADVWGPLKVEEGYASSFLRCTSRKVPSFSRSLEGSTTDLNGGVIITSKIDEEEAIGGKPIEILVKHEDDKNLRLRIAWGQRIPKKNFRLTMSGKLVRYMDTEMGNGGFEISTTLSRKALGSWRSVWLDKMGEGDEMNPATYFYKITAVESPK